MVDKYLIKDIEVEETLDLLVGCRGKDIQEIKDKMAEKFFNNLKKLQTLKVFEVVEDTDMEVICDNALIGSILVIDKNGIETKYTIQLFYIRDNFKNFYITKTQILKEEFMLKQENLEFGKQLIEILDIYTDKEWTDEPLDENEVNDLLKVLEKQLNLINGNITEKEYMEDNPIVDNEVILDRLEDMQENTEIYTITDILNIVCYFEDISLYEEIKRKIENKEIGVENCYTNIKKMLEK